MESRFVARLLFMPSFMSTENAGQQNQPKTFSLDRIRKRATNEERFMPLPSAPTKRERELLIKT